MGLLNYCILVGFILHTSQQKFIWVYDGLRNSVSVAEEAFYPSLFTSVPMTGLEVIPNWFPDRLGKTGQPQPDESLQTLLLAWGKPRVRNQLLSPQSSSFSSNRSGRIGLFWGCQQHPSHCVWAQCCWTCLQPLQRPNTRETWCVCDLSLLH